MTKGVVSTWEPFAGKARAVQPTLVKLPEPVQPSGNWLRRTWVAMLHERRLPTRLATWLDRLWTALGRPTRTIRVGECRLSVRRLAADEHYVREVIGEQAYNPAGFEIGPTDVVIDVGGNIGAFAVLAGRRATEGRVISVEPVESNFELLCKNLRRNRLDHVLPLKAAIVGRAIEEVNVFLSPAGSGSHSTLAELAGTACQTEQVPAFRLEDLFQRYNLERCDFLKLDCEGAEFEILDELPPHLAERICRIALEYHVMPSQKKHEQADRLIECLEKHGFHVESYTDVIATNYGMILARRTAVPREDRP